MNLPKIITEENYYLPNPTLQFVSLDGVPVTEATYIEEANKLILSEKVPLDVREIFETAKALYMYGYLYWTFFTVAHDYAFRALELAIKLKLEERQTEVPNKLSKKIDKLFEIGLITETEKSIYHGIRVMRNQFAHPSYQSQTGHNIEIISYLCSSINKLFEKDNDKKNN
ncbi:hypothetical protein GCM10008014_49910 [Paenibacillus silvae]|uniref:DUF4145 domain-containing protein n=1 Tax=Paenibacillus silvae TaxID=1325358 RepID=A0ABQ1ZJ31_9BACL|nr:DUF4145 domain-containing protein [Paenibacillus silvae]GGH67936.1 hypothetical protein GCM10008014_49910 [Paenibacillus silvae]